MTVKGASNASHVPLVTVQSSLRPEAGLILHRSMMNMTASAKPNAHAVAMPILSANKPHCAPFSPTDADCCGLAMYP
ncbi:hypothetical protein HPB47_018086 [Ixodes persulcatus]|uniref:Uncharacterized protein n=2 Tax=Ixodes persulcatus TaxID=34615 RepID=A0AC60QLU6_IXOPE|nr:hypothetical protein HPB47_002234 [Ixodes persulcatus]KAG0436188.1 hypothetical protein HPB47_018086 [Ixodes persulcatus]